ncbi:MAG: hypothetical protein AB8H47_01460 [Bacteroidia bacterium]
MQLSKIVLFSILSVFMLTSLRAQTPLKEQKLIGKLSLELGLAGSGDMTLINMENALEYKLNRYFTPSLSLALARSDRGYYLTTSLIQTNANIFFSPFGNDGKNDFRIGAGISGMRVSNFYQSGTQFVTTQFVETIYTFEQLSTYGFNVILEDNFRVSEHIFVGLRMSYQLFENGDQIIGGGLNLGIGI